MTAAPCGDVRWLGYLNEGGAWTRVDPGPAGGFSFDATSRYVVAARIIEHGIEYTQAAFLGWNDAYPWPCWPGQGTGWLRAAVAGAASGSEVWAATATSTAIVPWSPSEGASWFAVDVPVDTPVDLITAERVFEMTPLWAARTRAIDVRRGLVVPGEMDLGTINLIAGAGLDSAPVLVQGTSGRPYVASELFTATGARYTLSSTFDPPTTRAFVQGLSASARAHGDVHATSIFDDEYDPSYPKWRGVAVYDTMVAARTVAFGPALATARVISASDGRLLAVRLARQALYGDAVSLQLRGSAGGAAHVRMFATRPHAIDGEWLLSVASLPQASGWHPDWSMPRVAGNRIAVAAWGGIRARVLQFPPRMPAGAVVLTAGYEALLPP